MKERKKMATIRMSLWLHRCVRTLTTKNCQILHDFLQPPHINELFNRIKSHISPIAKFENINFKCKITIRK